jgi:hypothetical protein
MDEKGDLVTDSRSILARQRNHFSQLLNVNGVNVRQTEIHTLLNLLFRAFSNSIFLIFQIHAHVQLNICIVY